MIHLVFKNGKNNQFGSSFVFRKRNYSANETKIPGLKVLRKLAKEYDDVIFLCDKNSDLQKVYKHFKKRKQTVCILILVDDNWNLNTVNSILHKLNFLREKERKQIIFSAYGHVSRWAAVSIIEMGFRFIDVGQID